MSGGEEKLHIKPGEGPCEIHDWETEGLARRLIEAMRKSHPKGITVCPECVARAKADAMSRVQAVKR